MGNRARRIGYELEISTSSDFAPGSKICCSGTTTATSLSPTGLFQDNTYYWRVRPYDASNNAGPWTVGAPFTKTFDNVPPLVAPCRQEHPHARHVRYRKLLRLRLPWSVGSGHGRLSSTRSRSSTAHRTSLRTRGACSRPPCLPGRRRARWGPLAADRQLRGRKRQFELPRRRTTTTASRYSALDTDQNGTTVFGDWSLYNGFDGPTLPSTPRRRRPPRTRPVTPGSGLGYLARRTMSRRSTPSSPRRRSVFVWKPVTGAAGYYVVVSRDANFSNILDYAFTDGTGLRATPRRRPVDLRRRDRRLAGSTGS